MNCEDFMKLTPIEKSNYIGSIAHCVMNSSVLFEIGMKMIKRGHKLGLFTDVIINPITKVTVEGSENKIENLEWVNPKQSEIE